MRNPAMDNPLRWCRRPVSGRWVAFLAAGTILALVRSAGGQTSSLLSRSQEVASTRPAEVAPTAPLTPGYSGYQRRPVSPATRVLQQTSLIALTPEPPKVFKVHDLVTIIVREQKKSEIDATLDNRKNADFDATLDAFFRIHDRKWQQQAFAGGTPQVKGEFAGRLKGQSQAEREDKLETRITAEIVDVKPNGTLVLEGNYLIKHDEEEQIMTLTGVCRDLDITPDNTILSSQVGDKKIVVKHTGAVRDTTRRGWIPKMLDFLRPF
jgi:flagellar L-ring protein precursor FlgH